MTIFDPFFEEGTGTYDFAAYVPRRYNLENIDENLLLEPPLALKDHKNQNEVINYVLDKSFVEQRLSDDHIETIVQSFAKAENRDIFLGCLESDYKSYQLDFRQPSEIKNR